jgi:hypothetical protein
LWTKIIWDADIRDITPAARWVYVTMLALAAENGGKIKYPESNDSYLADAARVDSRTLAKSKEILLQKCKINVADNGVITIPNWHKYQSTTSERAGRKDRQNAVLDIEVDIDKKKHIYKVVFETWVGHPNIRPKHVKLTTPMEKAINARLADGYTAEQICQSIKNYGDSTKDFWVKRKAEGLWTLATFLSREEGAKGLGRFLDGPINAESAYTGEVGGGRSFIKR